MTDSHLGILKIDPYLKPHEKELRFRYDRFNAEYNSVINYSGTLSSYANLHQSLGFHLSSDKKKVIYKEWAPAAKNLCLTGDFNQWDRSSHPLTRNKEGFWEILVPIKDFPDIRNPESRIKVCVETEKGITDRIPLFAQRTILKDSDYSAGLPLDLFEPKKLKDIKPIKQKGNLKIYEAHIGMAQEKEGVGHVSSSV